MDRMSKANENGKENHEEDDILFNMKFPVLTGVDVISKDVLIKSDFHFFP